jgi:DNA-binding response OmpR family regulator
MQSILIDDPLFVRRIMGANLLIVEQHHEHGLEIYQDIFKIFKKYQIAKSENEANQYLLQEDFDMIIVNPFFEDGSGRRFIGSLRKNNKLYNIPMIVVSTLPAKQAKMDFYSFGADAYFEMPYDKEEFYSTIENKLKRYLDNKSNKGQDKVTGFAPREKFEQDYLNDQKEIKLKGQQGILGLVAPDGIDSVIKNHGLEMGDFILKETARLIKEMCCEDLQAVSWTHRSIVFAIMEKSGEAIKSGLEMLRRQFLDDMRSITDNPDTPGFHAVLSPIDLNMTLEESIDSMTTQIVHISQSRDEEPIQFVNEPIITKKQVLISDPDMVACSLLKHSVTKDGFIPTCFEKIEDIATISPPDNIAAMLIDTMVLGGGIKMVQEIKKDPVLKDIPIIIVSRFGHEHEIVEAFSVGAADYLMKPFSIPELSSRLKRLIN